MATSTSSNLVLKLGTYSTSPDHHGPHLAGGLATPPKVGQTGSTDGCRGRNHAVSGLRLSFCDFSHRPRGASDAWGDPPPRGSRLPLGAPPGRDAFERSPALQRWGKQYTRFESRRDDREVTHSSPELFMATNPLATIATRHRIFFYSAPITHDLLSNQQHRLTTTHSHSYN